MSAIWLGQNIRPDPSQIRDILKKLFGTFHRANYGMPFVSAATSQRNAKQI
jgi:hypothetical protein